MNYKIITLKNNKSKGANLIACQKESNCPFEIKRVFYIYDIEGECVRGGHANVNSRFLFIALNGSCKISLDDGKTREIVSLDSSQKALYIDKMIWKEMYDFTKDCVLLVLSDRYYDESEYINDYEKYRSTLGGK